jgi:hypothetical protein
MRLLRRRIPDLRGHESDPFRPRLFSRRGVWRGPPPLSLISIGGLKEKRFSPERKMNKWRSALQASKISLLRPESHGFSGGRGWRE